jgi:hypothetical protein
LHINAVSRPLVYIYIFFFIQIKCTFCSGGNPYTLSTGNKKMKQTQHSLKGTKILTKKKRQKINIHVDTFEERTT